jgi:hypothetical protein
MRDCCVMRVRMRMRQSMAPRRTSCGVHGWGHPHTRCNHLKFSMNSYIGDAGDTFVRSNENGSASKPTANGTVEGLAIASAASLAQGLDAHTVLKELEEDKAGLPHRWVVVAAMVAAFVLCNMDKVLLLTCAQNSVSNTWVAHCITRSV